MTGHDLAASAVAAVARLVNEFGAQAVPEGTGPAQVLAPAAALRVARQVELAARAEVGVHVRRAREDGLSWHEIGGLLGFAPLAAVSGVPVSDYAFDYCVGPRAAGPWFDDPPLFTWTCPACGQMISDCGPVLMPAADEAGHADSCQRLAAVQAEWLAAR
jgi:hypothetical protein